MNEKRSSVLRLKLKRELGSRVLDQRLNKHYDAQLPSFMLTYKDTIYFGHTKEEVIDKVIEEWPKILKLIESKNKKTANFLIDSKINSYDDGKLLIEINNVSKFAFKGLLNDLVLIEQQFSDHLKKEINIKLIEGKMEKTEKTKESNKKDEDHPLFMDVLNKFEGEVLR